MNVRHFTSDDLSTVQSWAIARGMVIDPVFLPMDCAMVESDGSPVAFAAFYFRPSVCAIDHFTTNPDATPEAVVHAFSRIEQFAFDIAKTNGIKIVQTFTEQRLGPIMGRLGYHVGTTPHILITKLIP